MEYRMTSFGAYALVLAILLMATVAHATPLFTDDFTRSEPVAADPSLQAVQKLIRNKQFDQALNAVKSLEKQQPENSDVIILKGTIYAGKGDLINARKSFEQALALQPNSSAARMNLAQLDLKEKQPQAAVQRYEAILANDSTNLQAMLGLAAAAAAKGQEAEYVAWLEKATTAQPSAAEPRVLLTNYYLQKNDARRALTTAQSAQSINPSDTRTLDALATAQLAAGETKNAVSTFGDLARLVPNDPAVLYRLATAQAANRDPESARASLNEALALKPDHLPAEMALASLDLAAGNYAVALKIAQRIQKQYPNATAGFGVQGDVLMAQKQFKSALRAYEKAWRIDQNGLLATKVHQALSGAGDVANADKRLLQWLAAQPSDVGARTYLAAAYLRAGHNKQAIEQYQLVLKTEPKNIVALNDLAWVYQQEKDPRALATAELGYQLQPNNPRILDTLGWILVDRGQPARAVELLQRAVETDSSSAEVRYHLAAALAKNGDKARARRELEALLAKEEAFPQREQAQGLLKEL
jgi:putative PEP-CTERM system TPR-repeat lipoprotein